MENQKIIVPCINPGLSCCENRLVATGCSAHNVWRLEVWCMKWRQNHSKDGVLHHCEKDYKVVS